MSAKILDGKKLADEIKLSIKEEIRRLGKTPGLALIVVGDDFASSLYIKKKEDMCRELGIYLEKYELPGSAKESELYALVGKLNTNTKIHGILVQLPLPRHIDKSNVIESIDPKKDVDGLHPYNTGRLLGGNEAMVPCTPRGIMRLLEANKIETRSRRAVVIGRSILVGKPVAALLLNRDSTVTVCHSETRDLKEITREADILISAVGKPKLVTADMVKKGAVVVDVGISRVDGKLSGDVDFENVSSVASHTTPVPGGVGPMTVIMLFENLLACYKNMESQS